MQLITNEIEKSIHELLTNINKKSDGLKSATQINSIIDKMYALIPENKRISYGIVHTVKLLSDTIFAICNEKKIRPFTFAKQVFESSTEYKSQSVALGIITNYGLKNHKKVFTYFKLSAISDNWEMREMTQMFFKKLIQRYPDQMKLFLLKQVNSENPNMRRFVAETLRPVQENKWFYKKPDYSLEILRYLFSEKSAYPRTAVGNNLSDLSRHLPDLIKKIVLELVESGDKNSYWIAYRACRNMVKKNPEEIMKLLKISDYKYKDRVYNA